MAGFSNYLNKRVQKKRATVPGTNPGGVSAAPKATASKPPGTNTGPGGQTTVAPQAVKPSITGGGNTGGGSTGGGGNDTSSVADPKARAFPTSRLGQGIEDVNYETAWQNPDQLISLWFKQRGFNPAGGGWATMQQMADQLPIQWLLLSGLDALKGYGGYFDWAQQNLNRAVGAGHTPSATQIMQALFNPVKESPAAMFLNNPTMSPGDQVQNMLSAYDAAATGTMPSIVQQALLDQMSFLGNQFLTGKLGAPESGQSFNQYLRGQLPNALGSYGIR